MIYGTTLSLRDSMKNTQIEISAQKSSLQKCDLKSIKLEKFMKDTKSGNGVLAKLQTFLIILGMPFLLTIQPQVLMGVNRHEPGCP